MKWIGKSPEKCDLCHTSLRGVFYDAMTAWGPWAIMCRSCFLTHGLGLGLGRGQKYDHETGKKLEG